MSTYADIGIRLNGQEFQVSGLIEFELVKTVNDHAWLTLSGKLPAESRPQYAEMALKEVKVEFDINMTNLFRGLATDFDLFYEAGQDRFFLRAASYTYEMDRNAPSRSFQNAQMLMADLTKQLTSYYPKDECIIDSVLPAQAALGKFTLQFRETDFAFLGRIASRFYTGLVPDATSLHPKLSLGIPEGEDRGVLDERESQAIMSRNISEYKEFIGNAPKEQTESVREEDFARYELFTPKLFNLGDKLTVGKVKLTVCEARSYLDKGIIRFTCVAAPEKGFKLREVFNRQITGASLSGTVLAVGADTEQKDLVKVCLSIDGEQKVEEATWFPYATPYAAEENTGWYIMPETNDNIRLTFPTEYEEDAVVTCAIRNKGTDAVNKPDQKYFRTKYGKRMIFEPDRFLFVGKNDRLGMTMGGKNHIKFTSPEAKFVIKAVGNINLTAENVVNLSTKNAITCAIGAGDNKQTKLKMDMGKTKGNIAFLGKVSEFDGEKAPAIVDPYVKKRGAPAPGKPPGAQKSGDFVIEASPTFDGYINEESEMPDGKFIAKLNHPNKDQAKYTWEISVKFDLTKHYPYIKDKLPAKYPKRVGEFGTVDIIHCFRKETSECVLKLTDILKENRIEYCGDEVTVKATTNLDGKSYEAEISGRILGKNPQVVNAKRYLDDQIYSQFVLVKAKHPDFPLIQQDATIIRTVLFGNESGARHFNAKGIPIYGRPNGWGIMQLDPPENEGRLWSWKENIEGSAKRIKGYIDTMYQDYTSLKNLPMSRWQWRMNLYRRYNGGYFWQLKGGKWEWNDNDKYAYCLKAIRTEKLDFGIEADSGYKGLVDDLRKEAKKNWASWYGNNAKFPAYLNKF